MLIDWFTVGAQIVNFLVLLALLKIFLFDRITRAMDEREEKINARFQEAEEQKQEAGQKARSLEEEKRGLEDKRKQLLAEAEEDAESKRKEWIEASRREVDEMRSRWKDALTKQKESFERDLQLLATQQVYQVSRRVLKDLADAPLEERMIDRFISRVAEMDRDAKNKFNRSLNKEDGPAAVRSTFEISTTMRQKITRAMRREIAEDMEIAYETEPALLAGIELKAGGKKISWNVSDYLRTLEENVMDALQDQARQDTGPAEEQTQTDGRQKDNGENGKRSD